MEELERHGYKLTPGTLYPILHELEEKGFLRSHSQIVQGKKRKYYEITLQGSKILEEVKPKIWELVAEVFE
jgi:PadR family transcriptional regulator PadR